MFKIDVLNDYISLTPEEMCHLSYITLRSSVCLCVCMHANSSETNGRIHFIFGGKMHLVPGSDLIYILRKSAHFWPSDRWSKHESNT